MSRVFTIADTHFGHKNIIRFRDQFSTPEEHDMHIVNRWNNTVKNRDIVIVLGDFSFTSDQAYVNKIRDMLHGTIKLVTGNHDQTIPHSVTVLPGLYSYKHVWMSHAPIHPLELRGRFNIHGHTHAMKIPDLRYLCVSCEQVDFTPVDFSLLKERLEKIRCEAFHYTIR